MSFKQFDYFNIKEIKDEVKSLGLDIDFSEDFNVLGRQVEIGDLKTANSLAIQPMEGCDGNLDGSPGELTVRRYERFSKSGAGLLWVEAVAVLHEGRAYPRQLWINEKNADKFKLLMEDILKNAHNEYGNNFTPICIMQLTHSGRFSKPEGKPAPVITHHNPYIDKKHSLGESVKIISDDELERLEDEFVKAAILAKEAGFNGVDVKCCHMYLNSELLSAFEREGKYGGSFEGRTRFLLNTVDKIKSRIGKDFIVASRINLYDGIHYPYGWGVDKDDYCKYDLAEPIKLIKILYEKGVRLINLTMGSPYYNPHVNRPYDKGEYIPDEHPLIGVARLNGAIGEIQKAVPKISVVGTGYSWLRQFSPFVAAGSVKCGKVSIVGYGREALAYPYFARDILQKGMMKKEKCCITCSKCTEIMRMGGTSGCVIRDARVYGPIYKQCCIMLSKEIIGG